MCGKPFNGHRSLCNVTLSLSTKDRACLYLHPSGLQQKGEHRWPESSGSSRSNHPPAYSDCCASHEALRRKLRLKMAVGSQPLKLMTNHMSRSSGIFQPCDPEINAHTSWVCTLQRNCLATPPPDPISQEIRKHCFKILSQEWWSLCGGMCL